MSGRFQTEVQAAIAHDLLAIKTWGESTLRDGTRKNDYGGRKIQTILCFKITAALTKNIALKYYCIPF
jgi:hypothetical protein